MNKYLVAIHDDISFDTYIKSFEAESIEDCEDQLIEYLSSTHKCLEHCKNMHYTDFIDKAFEKSIDFSKCYLASEFN